MAQGPRKDILRQAGFVKREMTKNVLFKKKAKNNFEVILSDVNETEKIFK